MTIKLQTQKFPRAACYLTGGAGSGLEFTLLADDSEEDEDEEEDGADMESDDEESADDAAESAADDDTEEDDEADAEADMESDDSDEEDEDAEPEQASRKGTFQMLAHTGKVVTRWWGNLVLDMDGARFRQKLALLKDHMTSQPLGFSTKIERTSRGIEATGKLLKNAAAREVAEYSRQGYPWQASLMAVPTKVERVEAGATAQVNGREVLGPMHIFREFEIHELTLTTLGADDNTVTEAFAADGEIEVQIMTKKKNDAPNSGIRAATEQLSPQVGAPTVTLSDGATQERERVSKILSSADPSQTQLAHELVASGASVETAVQKLNADLRERLQAAQGHLRVHAQPLSSGNGSGRDGLGDHAPVNLDALPEDAEGRRQLLEREWESNPRLRIEFGGNKAALLAYGENQHRAINLIDENKLAQKLGGSLRGLGYRNVQGNYFQSYADQVGRMWHPDAVTEVSTDQESEIFKWLGNVANPSKFEGERKRTSLTDYGITLITEQFDLTVGAQVDAVRRDKTGQFMKRIREMAAKMAMQPERLVTQLLESNGTAYDGLPLYSNAHEVRDSGVQSNDITVSGIVNPDKPTSEEFSQVILEGLQSLVGLKDDHGDPANAGARDFMVVGPTKYMNAAAAALKNDYTSAGVSNTIKATDFNIRWVTNPRFNGAAAAAGRRIYIFRMDAELRALLLMKEAIPDSFQSSFDFNTDHIDWSAKEFMTVAPGRFELTNRINLSA